MGREIQKKKRRSSIPKVRQKPKSKKKILANPIIAAHWNHNETLSQNYRRLGLTAKLNHATGGTEKPHHSSENSSKSFSTSSSNKPSLAVRSTRPTVQPSEVRVERDENTGAILRILSPPPSKPNPLGDPLNDLIDSDAESWDGFDNRLSNDKSAQNEQVSASQKYPVVAQLEKRAAGGVRKPVHKQSEREAAWIASLVQKHGDNYGAMFRDMKLNVLQQSEGDIKRRVKRWKQAHRIEDKNTIVANGYCQAT